VIEKIKFEKNTPDRNSYFIDQNVFTRFCKFK